MRTIESLDASEALRQLVERLTAHNARLTEAINSLESGVGENDQPYRNEHGMLMREVCEVDYQRCLKAVKTEMPQADLERVENVSEDALTHQSGA